MTPPPPETPASPDTAADERLEIAIGRALDSTLSSLELEPLGADRFRAPSETGRFDRLFGGQVVAQALLAAARTVEAKPVHSLHAYFVETGTPSQPLELAVERVRDGRSISMRRIVATQDERPLLIVMASFHDGPATPELADPPPPVPAPEALPRLQDWIRRSASEESDNEHSWVAYPPPLEMRIGEAPTFMGGGPASGPRLHWMRLPRDVGEDPALHTALLAYASDYLLLDMVFRSHPEPPRRYNGFSLDHSMWLHRPVRLDRWHLYVQETQALSGHRGLVRGTIHDADGHLVASVMQEELARPLR